MQDNNCMVDASPAMDCLFKPVSDWKLMAQHILKPQSLEVAQRMTGLGG